jgi:molybdate transport system substrate-binding protein
MAGDSTAQGAGAHLAGISSMATRRVLADLTTAYEQHAGQRVVVESVGGVDAVRRIESGEAFDFVVLAAQAVDQLVAGGHVDPVTRIDLARARVAIAIPAGAPPLDLHSEQSVRQAVLAARSVGYSTGPSGRHLAGLIARWGIGDSMAARLVEAPPGVPVAMLVANGEAELGFQQLSEFMGQPGIDIAGTLPREIQEVTIFTAAICASAAHRAATGALLAFLASPEAAKTKRRHGMEAP